MLIELCSKFTTELWNGGVPKNKYYRKDSETFQNMEWKRWQSKYINFKNGAASNQLIHPNWLNKISAKLWKHRYFWLRKETEQSKPERSIMGNPLVIEFHETNPQVQLHCWKLFSWMQHIWKLLGNCFVFTVEMAVYHYVERIIWFLLPLTFCITYTIMKGISKITS